jgi:transposase
MAYKKISNATMYLHHKPADKLEIDFAGKKLSFIRKETGEVIHSPVFVTTMPYSGFTYVEALENATLELLLFALNR